MPWKESSVMEERLRFVARLLEGERMSDVCREFGISRKTGYKIFKRYKEEGLEALSDRSRRPVRSRSPPLSNRSGRRKPPSVSDVTLRRPAKRTAQADRSEESYIVRRYSAKGMRQ